MGHDIEQGAGGLSFVEIQRFVGSVPTLLKLIVVKSLKGQRRRFLSNSQILTLANFAQN
jgi:hypothetical protein